MLDNYAELSGNIQLNPIPYTEPVKAAIALKADTSKGLSQATMLLLGVLWGMILTKKEERVILFTGQIEMWIFMFANVFLLLSLYCQSEYSEALSMVHAVGRIEFDPPELTTILDYRDPHIAAFNVWHTRFLLGGLLLTGAALFSAHVLNQPEVQP